MPLDNSEMRRLGSDLGDLPLEALTAVRKSVTRGAIAIKRDLVAEATGVSYGPHFPRSITDTVRDFPGGIEAEVGPDKDRPQGALANILYFGTRNNGPRLPDPKGALDREADRMESALSELARGFL